MSPNPLYSRYSFAASRKQPVRVQYSYIHWIHWIHPSLIYLRSFNVQAWNLVGIRTSTESRGLSIGLPDFQAVYYATASHTLQPGENITVRYFI